MGSTPIGASIYVPYQFKVNYIGLISGVCYYSKMPAVRSWTDQQLILAVQNAQSYRAVLIALSLVPAGGNYDQIKHRIELLGIDATHFTGKRWNHGTTYVLSSTPDVETLLVKGSVVQSYKLKKKLFQKGIKSPQCELCGWSQLSQDGRIPVELDHINGDKTDNRLSNLRILCPNCHSLQLTHRGKNKKVHLRG